MHARIKGGTFIALLCVLLLISPALHAAAVSVQDDAGHAVKLSTPARRILSLAPSTTELLFAVGAGAYVMGVVDYSNYPPQASQLPSVGSAAALDMERIVALQPDLIVAWRSGNSAAQIARLRALHFTVFESEPRDFAAIATNMERLAHLAGTDAIGHAAAEAFRTHQRQLAQTYSRRAPVRVFYQIWDKPLMTLNDSHMASAVIRLCGGVNIFGKLGPLAPTVGLEAVMQADPEAIIDDSASTANSSWQRFPHMTAVARGNLFAINPDWMSRPGPRVLDGAEALCRDLDSARARRK